MTAGITSIICLTLILSLCPRAHSQSGLRCGDEFRIETQDGTMFQGDLRWNDGDFLVLWNATSGSHTIWLSDVRSVFLVKRNTAMGIFIGSVAGIGLGLATVWAVNSNREQGDLGEIGSRIAEGVAITFVGGVVGCLVGEHLGQSSQRLREVQLEALPTCFSPSRDMIPLRVKFAFNF